MEFGAPTPVPFPVPFCGIGWMTDVVGYIGVPNPVTPSAVKRLETVFVNSLV